MTHRYRATVAWTGSTAVGYDDYDRSHSISSPPAEVSLSASADPAFRGDPSKLNPEQLLLAAAASCQLLSFLAVCARARIDVVAYSDDAEAAMPEDDRPVRITRIILRPRIVVATEASDDRIRQLVDVAHRECFIANSLRSEIEIEPTIERAVH